MHLGELSFDAAVQLFRDICIDLTREGWINYARITPLGWIFIALIGYIIFRIGRWTGRRDTIAKAKN